MNKNMTKILSVSLLVLSASCGDDGAAKTPDAAKQIDAPKQIDATPPPAAPTLGTQIDRLGRPAINTALNHAFVRHLLRLFLVRRRGKRLRNRAIGIHFFRRHADAGDLSDDPL